MLRKTLLAAGALAASLGAGAAQAQTEITWWHAMGGRLGEVVNEIATKFNESQSDYRITPIYKGGYEETLTGTIAAFRAGEQPNIVQVFDAGSATIIGAKGAVIPAEDLLKDNGYDFDVENYIPGVRYFYADSTGKMVGMPFNSSTPILYYNEEALKKAGVEAPRTWEEFEQVAPKIQAAGYVPLAQSHLPWIFVENFFSRHNLQFATQNNGYDGPQDVELLLSKTPALVKHFNKLKEWQGEGYFGYYGPGWNDNQQPFENGEVAMWIGSSGSFGGLQQSMKHPFSATYLPYWGEVKGAGGATFIGGAALFALSGHPAEENKASAAFFDFLTSPEIQYLWHRETGYVPITTAAYELAKEDGYYKANPAAETGILQLSLPGGEWTKGYRLGFYPQVRDVINRETGKIFAGETSVEDALKTIDQEGDKILERFAKTSG